MSGLDQNIKTFKIRKIRQIRRDGQDAGQDDSSDYGYNLDYRWWCVREDGCYLQLEANLMPNFTCHPRCSGYANPQDPKDQDVFSRGRVLRGVEP